MGSNGGSSSSGFESNIVKNDWWSDWFFGPHFGQNPLESIGSLILKKWYIIAKIVGGFLMTMTRQNHLGAIFLKAVIDESLNWSSQCSNMELWLNPGLSLHNSLLGVCWILVIFYFLGDALKNIRLSKINNGTNLINQITIKQTENIPLSCCSQYFGCMLLEFGSLDQQSTPQ
jgi:hypothetical protein